MAAGQRIFILTNVLHNTGILSVILTDCKAYAISMLLPLTAGRSVRERGLPFRPSASPASG